MPTVITGTDGVSQVQTGAVEATDLPSAAYQKNNILGTVSESSGVPTGAIIERGSNANGEFVKYADGTMICIVETNLNQSDNNGRYDTLYPAIFSNATSDFRCAFGSEDQGGSFTRFYNIGSVFTGNLDKLFSYFGVSSLSYPIRYTVIGRWY